jgi:hypothetical protein
MNGSFRKSVLQHRIALETVWPLAFPKHDFVSLRLTQAKASHVTYSHWNEEAWARAAREYHRERRQLERRR